MEYVILLYLEKGEKTKNQKHDEKFSTIRFQVSLLRGTTSVSRFLQKRERNREEVKERRRNDNKIHNQYQQTDALSSSLSCA